MIQGARGTGLPGPQNPQTPPAHQISNPVKIEIHDSLEAVDAPAWDALQSGSPLRSPFLAWTLQSEWVAAFGGGRRLELRQVTDGTWQLVGLLPLIEIAPNGLMLPRGPEVSY